MFVRLKLLRCALDLCNAYQIIPSLQIGQACKQGCSLSITVELSFISSSYAHECAMTLEPRFHLLHKSCLVPLGALSGVRDLGAVYRSAAFEDFRLLLHASALGRKLEALLVVFDDSFALIVHGDHLHYRYSPHGASRHGHLLNFCLNMNFWQSSSSTKVRPVHDPLKMAMGERSGAGRADGMKDGRGV
eukprot:582992-Hanusia_phi.AAC.1